MPVKRQHFSWNMQCYYGQGLLQDMAPCSHVPLYHNMVPKRSNSYDETSTATPTAGKKRPDCWPENQLCSAVMADRIRLHSRWLPAPPLTDRDPPPPRTLPSAPSLPLGRRHSLPPPPSPPGFKNTNTNKVPVFHKICACVSVHKKITLDSFPDTELSSESVGQTWEVDQKKT